MPSRAQSVVLTYVAWDASANAGKTGDVANHTLRWIKDGTSSAPTNTPAEVDATNAPGIYKLTLTTTECTCDCGTLGGKSSTANVAIIPLTVTFEQLPTAAPNANGGLPILSSAGTTLAYTISTLTTYTGNTPQTGDNFARIGAAGAGLTALGDARIANLDATISSRMATYTQPTGFLAATFPTGTVASTTNITAGTITTTTNLTNLPAAPTDWLSAAAVSAAAVTKIQAGLSTYAGGDTAGTTTLLARLTATRAGYLDNLSAGAVALHSDITGLAIPTAAQVATAVWTDLLASADFSTAASIGKLLKDDIDAAISSRMATYAQPSGFLAATFPGTVASPTNITAGTMTTVTNLTNLPVPPTDWLTAAGVSAAAVTKIQAGLSTYAGGAVASVTGNVGGNVTGTVGGLTTAALAQFFSANSGTTYASAVAGSVVKEIVTNVAGGGGGGLDAAGVRAAVGLAAANLDTQLANRTGYLLAPAGLDAVVVEAGVNARQALAPILAASAGVISGQETGTVTIKGGNVTTTRIVAVTDASGNRTAVTLTLPS